METTKIGQYVRSNKQKEELRNENN